MARDVIVGGPNPTVLRILELCGLKDKNCKSLDIHIGIDELIVTAAVICTTQEQLDAVADLIGEVKPMPTIKVRIEYPERAELPMRYNGVWQCL